MASNTTRERWGALELTDTTRGPSRARAGFTPARRPVGWMPWMTAGGVDSAVKGVVMRVGDVMVVPVLCSASPGGEASRYRGKRRILRSLPRLNGGGSV